MRKLQKDVDILRNVIYNNHVINKFFPFFIYLPTNARAET